MKHFSFFVLLYAAFTTLAYADTHIDSWTDNQLCGWMQSSDIPKYISDEVNERELYCIDGVSTEEEVNVVEVLVEVTVVEVVEVEKEVESKEEPEPEVITTADEDLSLGIPIAKQGDFNSANEYLSSS